MKLSELTAYKDIAIQCHNFPDADTIACGYAVYKYLRYHGINAKLFYSGPKKITKSNMLIMIKELDIPVEYIDELDHAPELLVTVDCAYGESNVKHFDAKNIAVIDHHICKLEMPPMSEVRSNYGSCSTIIYKMLLDEGFDVDGDIKLSTALYYGLYTDTNSFSELSHAADKDLRDFAKFDMPLITVLKNSVLSCEEMGIAAEALNGCVYMNDIGTAIVEAKPCDPNILGFISDLLLQVDTVSDCVVFCSTGFGYKLSVRSCSNQINASEFVKYITENIGNGGGHADKAGGMITDSSSGIPVPEIIRQKIISYFKDTDILRASKDNHITGLAPYIKQSVTLGYIPSLDIVPEGTEILIRMLEADTTLKASADTYIMVGISGEVYPINKTVFEQKYVPCDELPDMDQEYPPAVIDSVNNIRIPLADRIKGCTSAGGSKILAKQLIRYTKVFTLWDPDHYLYGRPGDYLAMSVNDSKDIYIVRRDIFEKTYRAESAE